MHHGAQVRSASGAQCKARPISLAVWSLWDPNGPARRDGGREMAQIVHLLLQAGADPNGGGDSEQPLYYLARMKSFPVQADIAADLVAHGADDRDPHFGSSLAEAAGRGNSPMVLALLEYPDQVKNSLNEAYLAGAYLDRDPIAGRGHGMEIVQALLVAGADVNARKYPDETVLIYALKKHDVALARLLLAHGADASASDRFGTTPLMLVVHDPALLDLVLEHNVDVNAQGPDGSTALHLALTMPAEVHMDPDDTRPPASVYPALDPSIRLNAVTTLLEHGADPNLEDKRRIQPLNLAQAEEHRIIDLLLAHGAQPSMDDDESRIARRQKFVFGPLTWALMNNNPYLAKGLLERDRTISPADCGIVLYAAEAGDSELLGKALALGADIHVEQSNTHFTPLIAAAAMGQLSTVKALLDMPGVQIDQVATPSVGERVSSGIDGWIRSTMKIGGPQPWKQTALMVAAGNGHLEVVQYLLRHGARLKQADTLGRTALDYAVDGQLSGGPQSAEVINLLHSLESQNNSR